jgi:hypothetical protein
MGTQPVRPSLNPPYGGAMAADRVLELVGTACRSALLDTLEVQLFTQLSLPGEEPYPAGAVDYWSHVQLTWYPDDATADDLLVLEPLARQGTEIDDGIRFDIGRAHFVMVDLLRPDLFEALDAREADLGYVAGVLFPRLEDGATYEIGDELHSADSNAVLVNSVEIDPPWRGLKLGLLSTGIALLELGRGCSFAALDAMDPGTKGAERRKSVHKRLSWYWHQLGFESWRERVMILDLSTTTLDERMSALRDQTRATRPG